MDYQYLLANLADIMMFIIAVYFATICFFGDRQDRKHSLILCIASTIACVGMYNSVGHDVILSNHEYSNKLIVSGLWDVITAAILAVCMVSDRKAAYQSLLLLTIWPITTMMVYELESGISSDRGFIYIYYTEILITIGAMQMAISYDRFIVAVGNIPQRCKRFSAILTRINTGNSPSDASKG